MVSTAPAPKPPSSSENGSPSSPCSASLFQTLLLQPPFSDAYFLRLSKSYWLLNSPSTLSFRSRCSSDRSKSILSFSSQPKFVTHQTKLVIPGCAPLGARARNDGTRFL